MLIRYWLVLSVTEYYLNSLVDVFLSVLVALHKLASEPDYVSDASVSENDSVLVIFSLCSDGFFVLGL